MAAPTTTADRSGGLAAARRGPAARLLLATVVVITALHGLIHLMGVVEGFGLADVPELGSLGPAAGTLWGLAAALVGVAALALARRWRRWWAVAVVAAVVSQAAVLTAWEAASAGTAANVVLATFAVYGWATDRREAAAAAAQH